jgi:hypothetical protein
MVGVLDAQGKNNMIKALDAGLRERQALMAYWDKNTVSQLTGPRTPFWRYLQLVDYDPVTDSFRLPEGEIVTVETCNQLKEG